MASSSNEDTAHDPQVLALEKLALRRVTPTRLEGFEDLLSLVGDPSQADRADTLYEAFKSIGTNARTAALLPSGGLSTDMVAAHTAAACESLGLSDDQQFLKIFGEDTDARDDLLRRAAAATEYGSRKIRAACWVDLLSAKAAERQRRESWYPSLLKAVRRHVASIRETAVPIARPIEVTDSVALGQPSYVHRKREEMEFHRLVAEGAKLIVFVGQAGMGKTSLAKVLAGDTHFVRVLGGEVHRGDLAAAFAATTTGFKSSPEDLIERLATLACGPGAPKFIVLDNLESADELQSLLPHRTDSTVVATCRRRGDSPPTHCQYINVGEMSRPQAEMMARSYAPNLSEEDGRYVADVFSGHPLIIRHVCSMLLYTSLPIRQFCDEIKEDSQALVSNVYTTDGVTLLAVLRRVLKVIGSRNALCYELLAALVVTDGSFTNGDFLLSYLRTFQDKISLAHLTQLLHMLQQFSLVELLLEEVPSVVMHNLTQEVLRNQIGQPKVLEVARRALEVFKEATDSALLWESIDQVDVEDEAVDIEDEAVDGAALSMFYRLYGAVTVHRSLAEIIRRNPVPIEQWDSELVEVCRDWDQTVTSSELWGKPAALHQWEEPSEAEPNTACRDDLP